MSFHSKKFFFICSVAAFLFVVPVNIPKVYAQKQSTYFVKVNNKNAALNGLKLNPFDPTTKSKAKDIYLWKKVAITNDSQLSQLENSSQVLKIQKAIDYSFDVVPNDPKYVSTSIFPAPNYDQWNLRKIKLLPVEDPVSNNSAWEIGTGSSDTIVAVIDTGIDLEHPDLEDNIWANTAEESGTPGVDDDSNGKVDDLNGWNFYSSNSDVQDYIGHGTHVAGTVAAETNNATGVAGICWECKVMPVKVFETLNLTSDSTISNAIHYAVDNGANVINMSLSGEGYSAVLQDAVDYAWSHDVIVAAAAGNDHLDTSNYSPAGLNNVIAVGATDINDAIGSFSNFGAKVDVTAPGVFVLSTRLQTLGAGGCLGEVYYYCLSGTSMATPHVSGVAALLYDYHRGDITPWDNIKIRAAILKNVDDLGSSNFDNTFGYGRLNALEPMQLSSLDLPASIPTLSLTTPTNNYFSDNVTLSGSVNSNDIYTYNLLFENEGTPIYNFTGRGNITASTLINQDVDLDEGEYDVTLSAQDFNGSVNDASPITINIDLTAPASFNITSPNTTTWSNVNDKSFSWASTTDNSAQPLTYDLKIDSSIVSSDLSSTTDDIDDIADGIHSWQVIAEDKAGNTRTSSTGAFRIDTTSPSSFTPGKTINESTARFTFSTTDASSGVEHYEVKIDGGSFVTKTSPYTTSSLSNGSHTVQFRAFDNAGNTRTVSMNFTIDSEAYELTSVGDLTQNGKVDLSDLSILATYWLQHTTHGDINHDGDVDLSDLSILAQNWQKSF